MEIEPNLDTPSYRMQADRDGGEAYRYGYHELAEYLAERGWTKAPGGETDE